MAREREREKNMFYDHGSRNCELWTGEKNIYVWEYVHACEYKHIDLLFFVHVNEEAEEVVQRQRK